MAKYRFGDIVREVKDKIDRNNNPYEYYIAGDHMDTDELHLLRRGTFAGSDVGPAFIRVFRPGQVLYGSRRTYLRKVAVADFEGVTANTTFVLESKDEKILLQSLLPFIMQSERFTQHSIKRSKGSTNPYVLFSDLCDYEVELPDIEEQRTLSRLLWAVDATRQAYKKLLAKTDELVKSQFLGQFGNPIMKEKDEELKTLGDYCELKAGKFVKASDIVESNAEGLYPCFGGNGQRGYVSDYTHDGNFPIIGRQGALCGNVQYASGKFHATEHAVVVTPKIQMDRYWLYYLLLQLNLNRYATGAAQPGLAVGNLERIHVAIPPLPLQEQFAAFVRQSDKSKYQVQNAIRQEVFFDV